MTETGSFLASLTAVAAVALLLLFAGRASVSADRIARGFAVLCATIAATNLLGVVAVTLRLPPSVAFYRAVLGGTAVVGQLITGVAVAAMVAGVVAWGRGRDGGGFVASRELSTGLAWFVAFAFFGFEVGKAAHDAQMRQFFTASGYPVAFMYVVMALEIVGAFGLLIARSRFASALMLGLVMLGAMATHARNDDPFSDSLDALRMLLVVASIAVLHRFRGRPSTAVGRTLSSDPSTDSP